MSKADCARNSTVQRSFVERVLQSPGEILRVGRVVPHEENGQVVGVRLFGVRGNSLLKKLGLQNGDVLRTLNGYNLVSPDSALAAYAGLRTASELTLIVTRRGRELTLRCTITDGE